MIAESPGAAYRFFSLLLLPFWLIHAAWHSLSQNLPGYFRWRLLADKPRFQQKQVWVHASSVGEVNAVAALVEQLQRSGQAILFTSFTASGLQTIRRLFPDGINSTIIPVDFMPICQLFLRRHAIKLCLLMETELWPELLFQTAKRNVPIVQVNARLSTRTTEAPIFVRYLLRRALANISLHLARNEIDRQLLIGLGAEPKNIKVIGNLKIRSSNETIQTNLIDRDYILLASSHDDEEELFLKHRSAIQPLIVIAPRHPKRSLAIQQMLNHLQIRFSVRSKQQQINDDTEVYLADTLGELKAFMAHAKLVVMGGSFDQTGGHNLIEPASLGCAIITGSSDSNISEDIKQLGDSIIQVDSMADCWLQIDYWLSHPEQARSIGTKAQAVLSQQSNVVSHYLEHIRPYF